ncbi:hypothetical protein [Staphylococcus chromogenes]|uniref:hypothetical protein n=1 Tax=Staphylococcus chromogenes TaxID=46126 RepID=UPI0021D21886|nr:hypothetical protein [Staphylococcus chromogenes]UXS76597.1 hypothetical protein MUA20_08145 [Staphylococcus chromogenes]
MLIKKADTIIEEVKTEQQREDKQLKSILFEIRENEVTMFFEYNEPSPSESNHHYVRHDPDPEFLDIETFEQVKSELSTLNIDFSERRDEFI